MKKIVLIALMALCSVSFGFGENESCKISCINKYQSGSYKTIKDCMNKECTWNDIGSYEIPNKPRN